MSDSPISQHGFFDYVNPVFPDNVDIEEPAPIIPVYEVEYIEVDVFEFIGTLT